MTSKNKVDGRLNDKPAPGEIQPNLDDLDDDVDDEAFFIRDGEDIVVGNAPKVERARVGWNDYKTKSISNIFGYAGIDLGQYTPLLFIHLKGGFDFRMDIYGMFTREALVAICVRRSIALGDYDVRIGSQ